MPADPAPADAELTRLLDAFEEAAILRAAAIFDPDAAEAAYRVHRAALLAYLDRCYVRRDRLYDDGPWEPGDGSAYAAALDDQ